jgi:hypothetical protein
MAIIIRTSPAQRPAPAPPRGCRTCRGRQATRIDAFPAGDPRGQANADQLAADSGDEAHVHFDNRNGGDHVVVRPINASAPAPQ